LNRSAESYQQLFDTVSEAIYILDGNATITDVNKGACLMSGYQKEELVGAPLVLLAEENKNDLEIIKHRIGKAKEGEPQNFEFWSRKKNGDNFLQELSLKGGNYFGRDTVIATGWDVTKRLRAEQSARESEQRFRTLQHASSGGIGLHDQGFIIDCNQGLSDLTGYSYSELIGRNGLDLVAPDWRPFVLEKIKSGYDQTYDVEGIRKDGTRYFLEIHGKNIPFQGRTIRVTEFRDITERKKSEQKILEQNKKLQTLTEDLVRKNNQLEEFTQIVSHNLRAPVGNIMTLLGLYDSATTDEERREYVNLLRESSSTTLAMLNDINDVLKIKQSRNIEKKNLKFQDVLHQTVSMLSAKISLSDAEILGNFNECPEVHYPEIYLESIMLNLLDNALKYADTARKPVIKFRSYRDRLGHAMLEVADNGLGINLSKYGHQMFKLRKTFHRHPESRGLGLFMIKNQIEAMGGEISVQSKVNEGTTFFVIFSKQQSDAR
jgi:PAS domain S-box-containing protein